MQKEWLVQFVALVLFFVNGIIYVEHEGLFVSEDIGTEFLFLIYHLLLFLLVNYVLIPKLFYPKKYVLFSLSLLGAIVLFGVVEEGLIEKILTPDTKGTNDVTWQSIYWFFGEILIPLLTFMTIKFVFDNFAQKQQLEQIQQNRLSNELQLLKSQIQPHILFNSLNNLYHFALKKSEELPDLILKLSNVLRYVVYEAPEEKVPLIKELSFIKDYIYLQEIQYKGRGKITYDLPVEALIKSSRIAPFLLIPFIENSFKHSFGTKVNNVFVRIQVLIQGAELTLLVENNYEESNSSEDLLIQGGIGLANVKKRLSLLYPNQHRLTIRHEEECYTVKLSLNLS